MEEIRVDELVAIDLEKAEGELMVQALNEYFGVAQQGFELLAPLVGQATYKGWGNYVFRLMEAIDRNESLSDLDWARALFLTEVSFTSDLVGAGRRFGRRDHEYWILVLRSLQDRISRYPRYDLLRDNGIYPPVVPTSPSEHPKSESESAPPIALEPLPAGDDELVAIDLENIERELMVLVLNEYAGLARQGFELLAPLVGLSTQRGWAKYVYPLERSIKKKAPLSELNWARALFLTEIGWGSALVGSGKHFGRGTDEYWITELRSLQEKVSTRERYLLLRDNALNPPVQLAER